MKRNINKFSDNWDVLDKIVASQLYNTSNKLYDNYEFNYKTDKIAKSNIRDDRLLKQIRNYRNKVFTPHPINKKRDIEILDEINKNSFDKVKKIKWDDKGGEEVLNVIRNKNKILDKQMKQVFDKDDKILLQRLKENIIDKGEPASVNELIYETFENQGLPTNIEDQIIDRYERLNGLYGNEERDNTLLQIELEKTTVPTVQPSTTAVSKQALKQPDLPIDFFDFVAVQKEKAKEAASAIKAIPIPVSGAPSTVAPTVPDVPDVPDAKEAAELNDINDKLIQVYQEIPELANAYSKELQSRIAISKTNIESSESDINSNIADIKLQKEQIKALKKERKSADDARKQEIDDVIKKAEIFIKDKQDKNDELKEFIKKNKDEIKEDKSNSVTAKTYNTAIKHYIAEQISNDIEPFPLSLYKQLTKKSITYDLVKTPKLTANDLTGAIHFKDKNEFIELLDFINVNSTVKIKATQTGDYSKKVNYMEPLLSAIRNYLGTKEKEYKGGRVSKKTTTSTQSYSQQFSSPQPPSPPSNIEILEDDFKQLLQHVGDLSAVGNDEFVNEKKALLDVINKMGFKKGNLLHPEVISDVIKDLKTEIPEMVKKGQIIVKKK